MADTQEGGTAPVDDTTMFSRTGAVPPMGTLTQDLKTKVDIDTELAFRRMVSESKTDVAGALRNYVYKVVHGKTYEEICYDASQRRRDLLLPQGLIEDLSKTASNPLGLPKFLRSAKP